MILATKKCRIHAACGVRKRLKRILGERRIIHYLQKRMIGLYENYEKRKCITQMYDRTGGRTGRSYFICCGYNSRTEKQKNSIDQKATQAVTAESKQSANEKRMQKVIRNIR